jgi:hypothetical protein
MTTQIREAIWRAAIQQLIAEQQAAKLPKAA